MMRQYLSVKSQYPDAVVFYRMGDFYEMFLDDATRCADFLDLTLTTRDKGKNDSVPMCGVPVHSAQHYIQKLARSGFRVAICEQVEDAKEVGRRLVKREVVEVITPGLVGDPEGLESSTELPLSAIEFDDVTRSWGLSTFDSSTGLFKFTRALSQESKFPRVLSEELSRISPREILISESLSTVLTQVLKRDFTEAVVTCIELHYFDPKAVSDPPEGFSGDIKDAAVRSVSAILNYVKKNQPFLINQIVRLQEYSLKESMVLDAATCSHLELFENQEDKGRRGTLLERIDRTKTGSGARCLSRWLRYPLLDLEAIERRQLCVEELFDDDRRRSRLREAISGVGDLERIWTKAARASSTPRDFGVLRGALGMLPRVCEALEEREGYPIGESLLPVPVKLEGLLLLLEASLVDDPPAIPKGSRGALETGYIRSEFHAELDVLRKLAAKGRTWIADLERQEQERTGIPKLKIRFHQVHGYFIEASKSQLSKIPENYERKQTLANVERFTTRELREMEGRVRGAQEDAAALERKIFKDLRDTVSKQTREILTAASTVGDLDALASLADVARKDAWVRPVVDNTSEIDIEDGRHPVVAEIMKNQGSDSFVPNSTRIGESDGSIFLLTGPNMSGKSTYLRQVGLLVLLAQVGSFVPASRARVGLVDRVFTRVGANDRQMRGESTFMVEMRETSEILEEATDRSLLILDEIGRGTSTFDGLAIAWAVAEHLHDTTNLCPRTLFATHFHELAELSRTRPRMKNMHFEVREWNEEVIFLRKLIPGEASRSFGIQVAKLAGLPASVLKRARERLAELDQKDEVRNEVPQLKLFGSRKVDFTDDVAELVTKISEIDLDSMKPIDALMYLEKIKSRLTKDVM